MISVLVVLLSCADPVAPREPVASAVVPPASPKNPTPQSPGPQVPKQALARIQAEWVSQTGDALRALTPEGDVTLKLRPGALSTTFKPGATVMLECEADEGGVYTIVRVMPQQGLEIDYGRVTAVSPQGLTIARVLDASTFVINRWSDLPKGIAVGDYLGVKHYWTENGQAILNARRMAGRVEAAGVVTDVGDEGLTVATLGGLRTFAVSGANVGDHVIVHYERAAMGAQNLGLTPHNGPLSFTGKHSDWDATTQTLGMVDAWGGVHGVVRFRLSAPLPADLVPGDLADTTWTYKDGAITLIDVKERVLSQVFFGRIDNIDTDGLTMTTLQRQPKSLRLAPDVFRPRPIVIGDMADVMWRREGEVLIAEAIVKE